MEIHGAKGLQQKEMKHAKLLVESFKLLLKLTLCLFICLIKANSKCIIIILLRLKYDVKVIT